MPPSALDQLSEYTTLSYTQLLFNTEKFKIPLLRAVNNDINEFDQVFLNLNLNR